MPAAIAATVTFLKTVGLAVGGLSISAGTALAIGTATVLAGAIAAQKLISSLYAVPNLDSDRSRQATVRGTVEPQKLIYGEALVSGPLSFVGVAGTDNRDLYHSIVLAGHPCDSISDIYFDDERIPSAHIDANGDVTTGNFGPKDGTTICVVRKLIGDQTTADSVLDAAFSTINPSEHIGTNLTYIVTKFTLTEESQETWDKFMPNDIKALVKGKKVYDPRQDSTSTYYDATVGVSTQRASDSTTWKWSENPVWCLVDYLTDNRFGMDIDLDRIDLSKAVDAADICDATVNVPGGSERRYTCNGVVFGTTTHKANINKILSSMNGMLTYTNGKYVIRAGAFEAVGIGMTLTEDHMTGPVKLKTSFERNERFNTITGTFIDPDKNYKEMEFPKVQITSAFTRDNSEELTRELKLGMTNSRYMAQRIAHKLIQLSDLQKVLTFPTNLAGVNISVGDRVNVTLSEFGYTDKTFVCLGWTFSESGSGGVNLTLREDDSSSYSDLAVSGYSTVTPAGGIQQGFFGVPDPSSLSATAGLKNIELDWTNPANMTGIIAIEVFASPNSSWSSAVKIGETIGTQFIHDESNGADAISAGDQRYYWVRARRFPSGEGTDAVSDRNPDSDTSTINATCGRVNWSDVAGSDNAPEDNATENTGALADLNQVDTAQIADNAVTSTQADTDSLDTALGSEFPTNGLSHYWPCNSVQGDILIDVVGGVNATQRTAGGATISTDSPSGKSFTNGASNGFTLLNDTQADAIQTSNGFAWSIWFKSETTSGDGAGRIITRDFSDNWGVQVKQDEGPNQTVRFFGEPDDEIVSTTVAQGEWHHICVVEDGSGDIFGYLNGEKVTSAITYTPTTEPRPVVVGCNTESGATGSNAFTGKLTEIRAYNRALTDTEVRALYRVPSASIPQELDGELIVDGTIVADKIQASSITVDKLSGDVSELFPSSYAQSLTLTNTNQETTVFTLPAPQLSISKRAKVDQTFEYTFQNSDSSAQTYIVFFAMQMKSKGATGVQVGASGGVYHVSYPFQYNQLVYLVGNHLADLDNNGKVGRDSSGAGLGQINGVYYDGYLNRTYVLVSQISVVFSTGDTMFFSPTGFTSTGTYYSPSSTDVIRVNVPANTTVSYRHHVNETFGPTTTATDFRGQMRTSVSYSNTTITLKKWFGTLELIS
jgi:hypothetical protein